MIPIDVMEPAPYKLRQSLRDRVGAHRGAGHGP